MFDDPTPMKAVMERHNLIREFPINFALHIFWASRGDWDRADAWFRNAPSQAPEAWPVIQDYMHANRDVLNLLYREAFALAGPMPATVH